MDAIGAFCEYGKKPKAVSMYSVMRRHAEVKHPGLSAHKFMYFLKAFSAIQAVKAFPLRAWTGP
jgi:hypothetical protein